MIDNKILLIGLIVGAANFLFRYLPLRLGVNRSPTEKKGKMGVILDSIGIASICSLLIVSSIPDVMKEHSKLFPTLIGCLTICLFFYKTRSIIISTLSGAIAFGVIFKLFMN
ncbi:L-valine transporter subunit YgaH [Xenorhabdus griffiniae]|uniref:L-valine transporter subunit YgaH n=1 Tax=Xenorhabdus griffiniae TaxID=351672 RepID=A0ABY9XEG4_9GAMM|nr:L-valine transporter subunit YgaH [Xenorhabdus griffiniae]MBD1229158.1 L-valine transporter subunit YgaH [Xenorhabdus griffiniae]MBE8587580.1 L-valine transporter subunit YgaH [Xenorhabdus griffiniae]MDC9604464.1 L-valine transporter subunit YgaH [Xenorhabdus griffiniae]WMV71311.1 L-valine transporter subunit YgaH [Xenorhabdus griffiniae]WNH00987.1 L-valine transporter subunit YgaH [Xenorhabdus griffiniae]